MGGSIKSPKTSATISPAEEEEDATHAAFFYGTLMAPEVFFTVCYNMARPPQSLASEHSFHPAILQDHSRRRVKGEDYPGVIVQEGHTVRGTMATGLTETNLYRLDYFEGREYIRKKLKVRLLDSEPGDSNGNDGKEVEVHVYLFKSPGRLEAREWDYDEFRREKLRKWSRADYVFDGCDPDQPAAVAN